MVKFWCWLIGHSPFSDGLGSVWCRRCLRRLP